MLQNEYLVAKIGVDTAENEPRKECCVVAASARDRGALLAAVRGNTCEEWRRGAAARGGGCGLLQGFKIRFMRDRIIRTIRKSAIFFAKFAEILRSERCEGLQIL